MPSQRRPGPLPAAGHDRERSIQRQTLRVVVATGDSNRADVDASAHSNGRPVRIVQPAHPNDPSVGTTRLGELFTDRPEAVADGFGISPTRVGPFMVAVGTRMPEPVTSMIAAARRESDPAVRYVVGSNILNSRMVLPACGLTAPIAVPRGGASDVLVSRVPAAIPIPLFVWVSAGPRRSDRSPVEAHEPFEQRAFAPGRWPAGRPASPPIPARRPLPQWNAEIRHKLVGCGFRTGLAVDLHARPVARRLATAGQPLAEQPGVCP